LLAITLSLT